MKPFTQVAKPHEDIIEGRFTLDVFAADLWQVANQKAPLDYQDPDLFFKKTYMTEGLRNILDIARARLEGRSGDSIIQLQTPFGGGKTHTLIALYHKAREWNARAVVIDGTALKPEESKLWEELERQLTRVVKLTKGDTAPGKEALINLLSENSPVLILVDELLEYTTKAAGVKVGDSNLAAQTFAFIQELTGVVSAVGNALLVLTLPSSLLEHYDENAEKMFQQLQKITGRVERIYTPVKDEEIEHVIRKRLFSNIDEKLAKDTVDEFVEYAKSEGLLSKEEASEYRKRFLRSYPFKLEVIDVLYKRWGSFPTFQRTRGVLRLLSIVVHDLLDKNLPFIRLGDINLENEELRRELIKHIGPEWDSIIAQDITSIASGAKKVDEALGSSYLPYKLGTVVSTTIFMMSFSGAGVREPSIRDIKLGAVQPEFSSTVIDTVISNLKEKLFYLSDEGLYFTNQPNLNRMIVAKEENVSEGEIYEEEKSIIRRHISRESRFKIYIHPRFPKDVADDEELKLIIFNRTQPDQDFLEKHGEVPRVYRNTLVFLCVDETQREAFYSYVRKLIALRSIDADKRLNLSDAQREALKSKLENHERREYEEMRKFYRNLFIPSRGEFKRIDLGLPVYGENEIDKEIYSYLRNQGEILERISSRVIKDKYLGDKEYIEIKTLYESLLKTPGELRIVSREGFVEGIKEGVEKRVFGLGHLENGEPLCDVIGETVSVNFDEGVIIVKPELCRRKEKESEEVGEDQYTPGEKPPTPIREGGSEYGSSSSGESMGAVKESIRMNLEVPVGQISTIVRVVNYLRNKFEQCSVKVTIQASDGKISEADYEDKILEALKQAGIKVDEF